MDLIQVENDPSLARDPNTNAILSVDIHKIREHRMQRHALMSKDQQLNEMQEKINKLEQLINNLINKNEQ